jgi:hypothetical protein
MNLGDSYADMGESLRRALPLTLQKLDWDRCTLYHAKKSLLNMCVALQVPGYKLGAELLAIKGVLGGS